MKLKITFDIRNASRLRLVSSTARLIRPESRKSRPTTTVMVEELLPPRNAAPMRTPPTRSEITESKPLDAKPSTVGPCTARNSSRLATPRAPNTHNPKPSTAAPIRCTRSSRRPDGVLDIFSMLLPIDPVWSERILILISEARPGGVVDLDSGNFGGCGVGFDGAAGRAVADRYSALQVRAGEFVLVNVSVRPAP